MRDTGEAIIKRTAVIIPAYNEGKIIRRTITQLEPYFKNIIFINDGSSDNTRQQALQTNAKVLSHPINLGQGAALRTGFDYALLNPQYEYFVTFDADGQHDPKDAVKMVNYLISHKLDVVLGSRFLGQAANLGTSKKMLLKAAVKFTNYTSRLKLTDAHNGLRVFNRKAAELLDLTMPDMTHASQINHRIKEHNLSYAELPVTITYTEYSKAKGQSALNSVNILFDILLNKATKKW